MAESAGHQQQERSSSLIKPKGDGAEHKGLLSARHGTAASELSEEQSSLLQRAAVRPTGGSSSAAAPAVTGSRFAHDLSQVPTHTETPGTGPGVRAKLTISTPGDPFEQEADRVADQVMSMPTMTDLQGVESQGEEPVAREPLVGRQSDSVPQVSDRLEGWLAARRGSGQPLGDQDRSFMESRFGVDLSAVRVHTDSTSVQMSRELDAQAFTYGGDIHFDAGRYAPGTAAGRRLLAHELTHVVQQTGGRKLESAVGTQVGRDLDADEGQGRPLVGYDTTPVVGALARFNVDHVVGRGQMVQLNNKKKKRRKTLRERVADVEKRAEWNKRRTDAILELSGFEGELGASKTDWHMAMGELGDAYHLAYKDHQDALSKQKEWDALQVAIVCGVLTAVAGGALGGLGEAVAKGAAASSTKWVRKLLTESGAGRLEDTIQSGVGETIDVLQGKMIEATPNPVSKEPALFRSSSERSMDGQWLKAQEFFNRARAGLRNAKEESFEDVSVARLKKKIEAFKATSKFQKRPKHYPVEEMRKESERWMWSEWLPINLVKTVRWRDMYGLEHALPHYIEPGSIVMERLDHLKISDAAGISRSGWTRFWMSEVTPLLTWAKNPQPPIKKYEF